MGIIKHNALIITSMFKDRINRAHAKALEIFGRPSGPVAHTCPVTPIVESLINDYNTFLVGPDGSKEGWPESDQADWARYEFIEWLGEQSYEDGSSPFEWLEVEYGHDACFWVGIRTVRYAGGYKPGEIEKIEDVAHDFCCDEMETAWNDYFIGFGEFDSSGLNENVNIYHCNVWPEGAVWDQMAIRFCPFCGNEIKINAVEEGYTND